MGDGQGPATGIRGYSRRAILQTALGGAALSVLAACGGGSAPTPAAAPTGTGAPAGANGVTAPPTAATAPATVAPASGAPTPAIEGRIPSPAPGVPDAYTKLPPPYKAITAVPGRGSKVTTFHILYGTPVAPRGENRFWQELEKRLGVQIEATFASGNGGYQEKLPALIAGGDIPDLTFLWLDTPGAPSVNKTVEQGAFLDLTPYLSGDALKQYPNLAAFPPDIWARSAFNKKIVGVPRPRLRAIGLLTFRRDWAARFGNPQPKTTDEFLDLMVAFTRGDPDGNGQNDTWGLGNQNTALFALNYSYFMHAAPNEWRKNPDGMLTNRIETEEYRAALAFCRRMWEAGVYHPDVLTMTVT